MVKKSQVGRQPQDNSDDESSSVQFNDQNNPIVISDSDEDIDDDLVQSEEPSKAKPRIGIR